MATKQLEPVYLAVGEDSVKRRASTTRIKGYVTEGFEAFNLSEFSGETLSQPEALRDALEQIPFSDPQRIVIIHNADKLSKDSAQLIIDYVANPNPTTVLFLEAEKLAKNSRLRKAIEARGKQVIIDCGVPKGYAFQSFVQEMAQKGHGIVLDRGAVSALVEAYGQDTALLENALSTFAKRGFTKVGSREVKELIPRLESPKPWLFSDALGARNYSRALTLFAKRKPGEENLLFWYALHRIRELICAKTLIEEKRAGELASVLGGPAWKYKNHLQEAKNFSLQKLVESLRKATEVERALKGSADSEAAFISWITFICK